MCWLRLLHASFHWPCDCESLGIMYFARYRVPINYIALLIFTVVEACTLSVATIVIGNSVFFEILLILAISSIFLAIFSQITHQVKGEDGVVQRNMYEEEALPVDIFSAVCCFIIMFLCALHLLLFVLTGKIVRRPLAPS